MSAAIPNCGHASDIGSPIAVGCDAKIEGVGTSPSRSVCNRCELNPDRGQVELTVGGKPRDRFDGIPLPGDVVAAIAKRIGADRLAKLWTKWTGVPCGCAERQEKMNAAAKRLMRWFGKATA